MTKWLAGFAICSIGCSGGAGDCTALADGDWLVDGTSIGMQMGAVLAMDVEGCSFAFTDWSMAMNDLPSGGTVEGDQVTLEGDDASWASCTGTVSAAGDSAEGVCDDDGATFTMSTGNISAALRR